MRVLVALTLILNIIYPISGDITNWSVSPDQEGPIIWKTTVTFSCSWTVVSRNYGDLFVGEPGNLVSVYRDPQYNLIAANDPDGRVYADIDDEAGTATLTIKNVTKADGRSFACRVTGYGLSELITLSVLEPPTTGVINFAAVPDFTSVALSWDAVEDATSYSVSWRKVGETDWTSFDTSETFKTFDGLVAGSEFEAKVDASNAAGIRAEIQPAEITFTTKDYPDIVCDVTNQNGAVEQETCTSGTKYCYSEFDMESGKMIYGCGLCPNGEGADCYQCVGNDQMPCNRDGAPRGPLCEVTLDGGKSKTTVSCDPSVEFCFSPNAKNMGINPFKESGCGLCPEDAGEGEKGDNCVQCGGQKGTACNAEPSTSTMCLVSTKEGPIQAFCTSWIESLNPYCYNETADSGELFWGCGLCPNESDEDCEICVGNEETGCNQESYQGGVTCEVSVDKWNQDTFDMACKQGVTTCNSVLVMDSFMEYGCGECYDPGSVDCKVCAGNHETSCKPSITVTIDGVRNPMQKPIQVKSGAAATITCKMTGVSESDPLIVTWIQRDGPSFPEGGKNFKPSNGAKGSVDSNGDQTAILEIAAQYNTADRTFFCKVTSSVYPEVQLSEPTAIIDVFVLKMDDVKVESGTAATLNCELTGVSESDPLILTWFQKDGPSIPEGGITMKPSNGSFGFGGAKLEIAKLEIAPQYNTADRTFICKVTSEVTSEAFEVTAAVNIIKVIVCDSSTLPGLVSQKVCDLGTSYCYSETETNGKMTYGCGLCPNGPGANCEQCVGNDKTPCNREGYPGGVLCEVTVCETESETVCESETGGIPPSYRMTCQQGVTLCYSRMFTNPIVYTKYGCGECPSDEANCDTVCEGTITKGDGNDETPCNARYSVSMDGTRILSGTQAFLTCKMTGVTWSDPLVVTWFQKDGPPIGDGATMLPANGTQGSTSSRGYQSAVLGIAPQYNTADRTFICEVTSSVYPNSPATEVTAAITVYEQDREIVCDVSSTDGKGVALQSCKGTPYCHRVIVDSKNWRWTYGCGLCDEGAEICEQCVGNDAKPCNSFSTPVGPRCNVTLNDGTTTAVDCDSSVKLCFSPNTAIKDNPFEDYGCGLCPAEEGNKCVQCAGEEGTGLACNNDDSPGTMCQVTTDKGPISARCLFGNPYCHSYTDVKGDTIYGCDLCPDGAKNCKQCEGNDAKPCNKEGSPGGVICDVTRYAYENCPFCGPPRVTPVTCKQGDNFCYSQTTGFPPYGITWPWPDMEYGCGKCPDVVGFPGYRCEECDGDKTKPCNKGVNFKCEMPKKIDNGEMVMEIKSDDPYMVNMVKYKCNQDYMMMQTWKGDIGWCRHDGTYELPRCVKKDDWFKVEFELVSQNYKMKDAGRVKARDEYADGNKGDWYAGCDDHMNNPAAGAVCRAMGFRYGRQIKPDRKMKPIENIPFGKTNTYCYHDDTLLTSESCNVDDYDEMVQQGWPLCVPDEQATVHCFNDWWKVDVSFEMVERSGKMFCPVQVMKEGNEMKMKGMDVEVKWGGITMKENDYDTKYFEEGTDYQVIGGFSKKKGFRAKFIGDKSDYDCYFCNVFMGGNVMNINSDKNHNCGAKFNEMTSSTCSIWRNLECDFKELECRVDCLIFGKGSKQCQRCFGEIYKECRCCTPFFCDLCPTCNGKV